MDHLKGGSWSPCGVYIGFSVGQGIFDLTCSVKILPGMKIADNSGRSVFNRGKRLMLVNDLTLIT